MIKEFDKLLGLVDVNINLQAHKEGVYCRIVFIPLKANPVDLKPREAWGDVEEVENFIRFTLDRFIENVNHVETKEPVKYIPPPKKVEKKIDPVAKIPKDKKELKKLKDKIVKQSGVPENNIVVAKVKPIEVLDPDSNKVVPVIVVGEPELKAHKHNPALEVVNPKMSLPLSKDIVLTEPNTLVESQPPEKKTPEACMRCDMDMEKVKASNGNCLYEDCPNGRYKAPDDIINEHGVNTKELTIEENKLKGAMIKDEVKAITPQEAFSDEVVVDMTNVEKEKREKEDSRLKLVFADKKEIVIEPEIGKSVIEQIDEAPINCEDPEYGHCNSIDNEGENDDLPQALQDGPEDIEEVDEHAQMEIDARDKKANEWNAPKFDF